jgi:dienelactone hydrolase
MRGVLQRDAHSRPSEALRGRVIACARMASPERDPNQHDALEDFDARQLTLLGNTKRVFVSGSGPAVIVMAEMPGIYPLVSRFARQVRDAGFTVWMPDLFGRAGAPISMPRAVATMLGGCISREFRAFAANRSSPVVDWLRALAAHAHPICGGRGVGAIGMCFTGNFALSMMLEPAMLAPVLAQPSLPMGNAAGMHIAPDELARVKARMEREDLTVLAYRFAGDSFCRAERFAAYQAALGDRFVGRVLPDSAANPDAQMKNPHSVVTAHLIDREGEPTRAARDEILAFFRQRLA